MLNDLQKKLLEMLTWLDRFIRDNNLVYYMVEGSLIGAARHSGFIPWDDDIDIAMPRHDYEKLCTLLREPKDHYLIETIHGDNQDYLYTFAKFYDLNTRLTERLRKPVTRGVYIDIFPLDGLGRTMKASLSRFRKIDRKNMFLMTRTCAYRKDRKWYKNLAIFFSRLIPNFLINEKQYARKIDSLSKQIDYDDSTYVSILMSTYRERDIHRKDVFGRPTELKFENISVLVPQHYDEYLQRLYGDWRKMPPVSQRKTAHDFVGLDLNSSFVK